MPRKDKIHDAVRNALIKDGWTITNDPLFLEYGDDDMYVDLGAERLLGAERDNEKIAVEIKSFLKASNLNEMHAALGQYQVYFAVLEKTDTTRKLYLALSKTVYEELLSHDTFELVIERFSVALIVVRLADEEIEAWKS